MTKKPRRSRNPLIPEYEHRHEPLLSTREFTRRMIGNGLVVLGILGVCLALGVIGYHTLCGLNWLDALVNASMILSGMGPVDPVHTTAGKWFESFYAIFSGVAFLSSIGVFLAPAAHRFLHRFHLEDEQ